MYTLVHALVVNKKPYSKWEQLDLSSWVMADIFSTYRAGYLILSSPMLTEPDKVNLESLRVAYSSDTRTLNQFLIDQGTSSLPTVPSIPVINTKYAQWTDAFRAGYQIDIVAPGIPITNPGVNRDEKTWLRMVRDNTNSMELFQNCLVSVNGYFHRTDATVSEFFVVDGAKSLFKSRQNAIGLWSFKELGGLRYKSITEGMFYRADVNMPLKTRIYFDLGEDISNKTVMLVLGGYLHFMDGDSFFQMSNQTVGLNISRIPLAQRYQESFPYLDFSPLALDTRPDSPTVVDMEQFYEDEKLSAFLTMSQSFFVILDTNNVFKNKIFVQTEDIPGSYLAFSEPKYPLFVGLGRVAEYWKRKEDGVWRLTVNDSYLQNKVFATLDYPEQVVGFESNETMIPFFYSKGYLLEVGKDF